MSNEEKEDIFITSEKTNTLSTKNRKYKKNQMEILEYLRFLKRMNLIGRRKKIEGEKSIEIEHREIEITPIFQNLLKDKKL